MTEQTRQRLLERWQEIRKRIAESHANQIVRDARSFVSAVASVRVPDDVFNERMATCLSNRCGSLRTEGEKHYCGGCRCPSWRVAELTNKLRMGGWKCPRGLFDRWSGPDGTTSTK